MSVPENEKRRPLGTDGAQENGHQTASTPSLNPPNIAGIDGPGEGEGLVPATAAAMAFLMEWCENGPWVLTSIVPDGKTTTATFDHKSVDEMRDWIDWRQGKQNIYFTVNVVFGSVKVKPNKGAISAIHAFHVDVDPRVGEDPAKEKERAARLLREYRPAPTVIIDSGGGMQGFWLLGSDEAAGGSADLSHLCWRATNPDERGPLSEGEQAEVTAHEARVFDLGESRNLKIETDLQADHCHSIDHIMRLPGTVNLPNKKKRVKGRKPALARVVEADWTRRYRLDDFTPAPRNLAPAGAPVAGGGRVVLPSDLPAVLVADLPVSDHTKMLIVQGIDPDNPNEDRSKVVWRVACQMVRDGCTDSQIAAVILDDDNKISRHVLDQPRSRQYAARQIARARVEAIDPELAELNARHVVIETMGPSGKCRIMERLPTPDGRGYVAFQSFEDFGNRYDHRRKLVGKNREGKDTEMPLGKWWKNNPHRRQHKTMVFLPGGADVLDGDALNLWNGLRERNGQMIDGYLMPYRDMPKQLCSNTDFRAKICGGDPAYPTLIQKNEMPHGVPQGAPISDLIANFYLLEFDVVMAGYAKDRGGRYMRYSDDILLILPGGAAEASAAVAFAVAEMRNHGPELRVKESKTCVAQFERVPGGLRFLHLPQRPDEPAKNGFEYLGFRYDGRCVYVRDSTISRFFAKVAGAAKRDGRRHVEANPAKSAGDLIGAFDFSLFSQRFSRVKKSNLTDDYRSWTFYSYLKRSAEAFGSKGERILKQARGFDEFMKARVASAIVLGVAKRKGAAEKAA